MTLTVIDGGGEGGDPPKCQICGIPHGGPCGMLARHLHHLALLGRRPGGARKRELALALTARGIAPVPLAEATHRDLLAWREGLTVADGTICSYMAHVRSFFDWLQERGIREDNPALRIPVPPVTKGLPRPIAFDDLSRALECAPPRIRLWIVLAAWCGLRSCEISGLRRESIRETAVPPVLVVTRAATKGGRKERIIPLSPFVVGEIKAAGLPLGGYAFRRYDGKPGPNQAWMVSHLVGEHLRDTCGISATCHSLRHFFATQAYRASRDLLAVRDLLGHSSVETTQVYAAFDNQSAVDAVNAIPAPPRLRLVREEDTP